MTGLSRYVKNLTRPHPHVMQQHQQVGGSGRLRMRSRSGLCGWWAMSWSVLCPYPCFPCCIMPHKSSMGITAAWHSLISMFIIVMHRTHDRLWLTLWTAEEANGGAWNIAVACSCMAGRQGLAKPITWQENILIGPINHAPDGSQSQDPGLTPLDLVHRFGRSGADGVVNQRCSKRWSTWL